MILIVACGNSLRRDDGAGLLLAEKLEELYLARQVKVQRIAVQQLTPELSEIISDGAVSKIMFVDTRVVKTGSRTQAIQIQQLPNGNASPSCGHHLEPLALMIYACRLFGKRPPAWKVTVPGVDFGYGEGLSETSRQAIVEVKDSVMAHMLDFPAKLTGSKRTML